MKCRICDDGTVPTYDERSLLVPCPKCGTLVEPDIVPIAHTCPAIDRLQRMIRSNKPLDRKAALALLEELRRDNAQLRANAAAWEMRARK